MNMPPPSPHPQPSAPRRSLRDRIHPRQSLRDWWLDIVDPMRHTPSKDAALESKSAVDELQVAVFILMPSQEHGKPLHVGGGLEQLGELTIGIAGTPWDYDSSALDTTTETRT